MKKNNLLNFINNNALILIIALSLILRMIFFLVLQPWDNEIIKNTILQSDAVGYHKLALSLIAKHSFIDFGSFRTPGYPVFTSLLYYISSNSIWFVLFIQILLNTLSILFIYKIGLIFFNRKTGLLAALLYGIDLLHIVYATRLLTDTLFGFLFLGSIYFLVKYYQYKKNKNIGYSALLLGIATLVRPITLFFPFIMVLYFILFSNKKFLHAILYITVFMATISPWLIHNYTQFGEAKLSSITGYNLLLYNVASTEACRTSKPINQVRSELLKQATDKGCDTTHLLSFKNTDLFTKMAIGYIHNHFFDYLNRNIKGAIYLYSATPSAHVLANFHQQASYFHGDKFSGNFKNLSILQNMTPACLIITIILFFYLFINYIFMVIGSLQQVRLQPQSIYLFIAIIVYFTILTGVVGGSRYRIPFMPFINILCAIGILNMKNIKKTIKKVSSNSNP